jgi:hypothetical protein
MTGIERRCDFGHPQRNALVAFLCLNNGIYRKKAYRMGKV